MALQTRYKMDPLVPEEGGGEILVETAGYVPADIRIRSSSRRVFASGSTERRHTILERMKR